MSDEPVKVGSGDQWIVIDRWDEFQHPDAARSGVPPWIKTYTRLLDNDEFLGLSNHLRGVLLGLWLAYAAARRQLRDSTLTLTRQTGQRIATRDLVSLNHAGFIHFAASKPASAPASKVASLEKRREERPTRARAQDHPRTDGRSAYVCPVCPHLDLKRPRTLAEHLEHVHRYEPEDAQTYVEALTGGRT